MRPLTPLLLLFLVLAFACGGKSDADGKCVDISIGASDVVCTVDQDCTFVLSGHVCDGDCACGSNAAVNQSAASRVKDILSSRVLNESCSCGFAGYPRCIAKQCESCAFQQGACTAPPSGDE